jgi:hypothetical protein
MRVTSAGDNFLHTFLEENGGGLDVRAQAVNLATARPTYLPDFLSISSSLTSAGGRIGSPH